ncbi:MAG: DUF839 domain-containing protein [Xenococcaceae cyanobacterium MO_188.B29]|nr:DUF839 domain-containing protein [Xenococcaceae cyanobacterium MO_188.B29]
MSLSRRNFLGLTGVGAASFVLASPLKNLYANLAMGKSTINQKFGNLIPDPQGVIDLPKGFKYHILSSVGTEMDDGNLVPDHHDGMAAFPGADGTTILVRNHELSPVQTSQILNSDIPKYDAISPGGTTTVIVDSDRKLQKHFISLAGTNRNCGGGSTPWNSWISCEEDVATPYAPPGYTLADVLPYWGKVEAKHGYNFEVPATEEVAKPVPLVAMGRFRHEAIAVDPKTGYIYQTEDQLDSCLYRFRPHSSQNLQAGGILEALVIKDFPQIDTSTDFPIGKPYAVEWVQIEDVDPEHDTLRYEAQAKGAALFKRGEGICYGNGEMYWTCTNGGKAGVGQIFRYSLEQEQLELFIESPSSEILDYPDNLILAPFGDLIVCEDGAGEQFLVGITPEGQYYRLAKNAFNNSEFAGICFAPDGKTMFVNIYKPGMTLAIWGY